MNRLVAALASFGATLAASPAFGADPTNQECSSAINTGEKLLQAHKLVEARQRFAVCVATSCRAELRADCVQRLDQVNRAMPTIVFEAKDAAGNDLSAVRVTMDGAPLVERLDGTAIPIDPGEHRFVFEAEGQPSAEKTIVVREGDKNRRERVVLGKVTSATPRDPGGIPDAGGGAADAARTPPSAYVAFAAAGVGLVVGVAFTVLAVQEKGKCGASSCDPGVKPADNDSLVRQDTIVAGAGYGIAVLSAGLGLLFLSTNTSTTSTTAHTRLAPWIRFGWAGVEGRFQ